MAKEDITLSLGIQFGAEHFKKAYDKSFRDMQRDAKKATRGSDTAFTKFTTKVRQNFTKMPAIIKKANKAIAQYNKEAVEGQKLADDATKTYIEQFEVVQNLHAQMISMTKEQKEARQEELADQVKLLQGYKDKQRAAEDYYDRAVKGAEDLQDEIADMELEFSGTKMIEAAEEAGKELAEPFSALLSKDIPGAAKSFSKLAGKGFGGLFNAIGKGVGGFGAKMTAKADKMKGGGDMGMMAKSLGGIGKAASALGPLIQTFAKIGPILGTVSAAIVGLVKLFIDAEAAVKEWNKELVTAGGMNQFFAGSMGSATGAVEQATDTLDKFRNAAYGSGLDFTAAAANLDWGITADTHKEVLANLQAEGISLGRLEADYGDLVKQSGAYTNSVAAITQAAVAWSRNMGVSLQEVTGFQAEMMTDLGMSLSQTTESFRQMSRASADSGIATNKFFGMIRGISSDLSLYNTRLSDAVRLLGKLGKVMSPRNAQKFMQTAMDAYKGMSFQDKVKSSLLAGPEKTAKIVAEDIASKNKSIAEAISKAGGGTVEDVKKALEAGPAGKAQVKEMLKKVAGGAHKGELGTLTEAVGRLNIEKKRAKGGMTGNAAALSQVNMVAALEHKLAAASHFGGPGGGIGGEAGGDLAGMTEEERIQGEIMKEAIDDQRAELVKQGKMTEKEAQAATWTKIWDTMDQGQKDEAEGKNKEEEANKRMGTNVQGIMDKLQVLIDWFMNTFYNLMTSVWDTVLDIADRFGAGDAQKRKINKLQLMAQKSGNKELSQIFESSQSLQELQTKLFKSDVGQAQEKVLLSTPKLVEDTMKQLGDLEKQKQALRDKGDEAGAKKIADQQKALQTTMETEQSKFNSLFKGIEGQLGGVDSDPSLKAARATTAAGYSGLSEDKTTKLAEALEAGKDLQTSMSDAGLSDEEQGKLLEKLRLTLSPQQLGAAMTQASTDPAWKPMTAEDTTKSVDTGVSDALPDANATLKAGAPGKHSMSVHDSHLDAGLDVWVQNWPTSIADAQSDPAAPLGLGADPLAPGADVSEEQVEQAEATVGTLAEIENVLKNKGIKLNKSWMDNHMKKMIEEATLDALRTAMPEFIMLQGAGPEEVAKAIGRGVDPKEIGTKLVQAAKDAKGGDEGNPLEVIKKLGGQNAAGGFVSGINKEGIALVAKGEQIVPAGGGGGAVKVELSLKGDLAALIEAKAQETIVKHEAASKFR